MKLSFHLNGFRLIKVTEWLLFEDPAGRPIFLLEPVSHALLIFPMIVMANMLVKVLEQAPKSVLGYKQTTG